MSNSKELTQLSALLSVDNGVITISGKLSATEGTDANHILTKSQVEALIATKDNTDEITEGSTNLYYTEARVDANFASKDTGDLTEGANLYYTDARVQTKLGDISGHLIPDTDITYDLGSATNRFRDLYLSSATIYLGDIKLTKNADTGKFDILDSSDTPVDVGNSYNSSEVDAMIDDLIAEIESLTGTI